MFNSPKNEANAYIPTTPLERCRGPESSRGRVAILLQDILTQYSNNTVLFQLNDIFHYRFQRTTLIMSSILRIDLTHSAASVTAEVDTRRG